MIFRQAAFFPFFSLAFEVFPFEDALWVRGCYHRKVRAETGNRKKCLFRSIAHRKAGEDGMEMVLLEVSSPFCIRSDLELHGEEDGTEHVRRKPWGRIEIRIVFLHDEVDFREVKVSDFFHNLPCGHQKEFGGIWIVFTKLFQNAVLVGGMSASVKWFQFRNTPNQKVCTGCAGTICLLN